MSLLGNTSVRTILAAVFLILAAGLCSALTWQLYTAWELTQSAVCVLPRRMVGRTIVR